MKLLGVKIDHLENLVYCENLNKITAACMSQRAWQFIFHITIKEYNPQKDA